MVECADCGMVFIGNELSYSAQQEDHDWIDEHRKETERRRERHPVLVYLSRLLKPLRGNAHDRMLARTLRWRREGKLADFGCGEGRFLERAAKYFELTGIELSPRNAELSARNAPSARILRGPVTEVAAGELAGETFDVVTQFGYLEHEWEPVEGLRAAYRVLKPGGVTIIKTPNYACWNRRVMGLDWPGYHLPAHCNYFTPKTLERMLRMTGFERQRRRPAESLPTSDSLWMTGRKAG